MKYYLHANGNEFSVVNRETKGVYLSISMADRNLAQRRAMDVLDQLNDFKPRRVILESPFGSDSDAVVARNIRYARACLRDSVMRGEAPIASHLLFTQPGVLRDRDPGERKQGIEAGLAWAPAATASVFYTDLGMTPGMEQGRERAAVLGLTIEKRQLGGLWPVTTPVDQDMADFIRAVRNYFAEVSPHDRLRDSYIKDAERLLKRLEAEPCR